jgi:hypothetical protein
VRLLVRRSAPASRCRCSRTRLYELLRYEYESLDRRVYDLADDAAGES